MNGRKVLSLSLASIAVLTLAFGSGAFTSVSAERGVSLAIVGDDNAYVGYEADTVSVYNGERTELVTVENRLTEEITVDDVDVESDVVTVDNVTTPESIGTGDNATITGDVSCEPPVEGPIEVSVEVSGTDVWASLDGETRAFQVDCAQQPSVDSVTYYGNGKVKIHATNLDRVDIEYVTLPTSQGKGNNGDGEQKSRTATINTNEKIDRSELTEGGRPIAVIYFPDFGEEARRTQTGTHTIHTLDSVDEMTTEGVDYRPSNNSNS